MWKWKKKSSNEVHPKFLSIVDVTEYFLYLIQNTEMDATKLQKLTYYAQSLHLVLYETPLFQEDFEAWVHGPISPTLYYHYHTYRHQEIPYPSTPPNLPSSSIQAIEIIWKLYVRCTGRYLERKVFNEEPFQETRKGIPYYLHCNEIIPKELMKQSYAKKIDIRSKRVEEIL